MYTQPVYMVQQPQQMIYPQVQYNPYIQNSQPNNPSQNQFQDSDYDSKMKMLQDQMRDLQITKMKQDQLKEIQIAQMKQQIHDLTSQGSVGFQGEMGWQQVLINNPPGIVIFPNNNPSFNGGNSRGGTIGNLNSK